jgi:murein L,D-transpeptidase YafK
MDGSVVAPVEAQQGRAAQARRAPRLSSALALGLSLALVGSAARADEPPRVQAARGRVEASVRSLFAAAAVPYPPAALLLRAFKREGELELWAARGAGQRYARLKSWPICARSGSLGPKRREGDGQVPEGFYRISALNPWSSYHLSLRVDYPNRADRILGRRPLGGDIFIHGKCVTIGCLPLGDAAIEELYVIAADARAAGAPVQVHLLPGRFEGAGWAELQAEARGDGPLLELWEQLREGDRLFRESLRPPRVRVASDGRYLFSP